MISVALEIYCFGLCYFIRCCVGMWLWLWLAIVWWWSSLLRVLGAGRTDGQNTLDAISPCTLHQASTRLKKYSRSALSMVWFFVPMKNHFSLDNFVDQPKVNMELVSKNLTFLNGWILSCAAVAYNAILLVLKSFALILVWAECRPIDFCMEVEHRIVDLTKKWKVTGTDIKKMHLK